MLCFVCVSQADKKAAGEPSSDDEDELDDEDAEPKPIKSLFELNDTLYAEAQIQETGDVYLWLGVSTSHPCSPLPSPSRAQRSFHVELALSSLGHLPTPDPLAPPTLPLNPPLCVLTMSFGNLLSTQANVMLSYPLADASALLASKLHAAEATLVNLVEDVEFLKEQITIMEVNTARVYNFDVKRR